MIMKKFFAPLFHGRDKKKSDPAVQAQGQMDVIRSPLETMVDAFRSTVECRKWDEPGTCPKTQYIWGFRRVGSECGRDPTGTFHCVCGQCAPLRVDVGQGGKYRGDDSGDGRYEGEEHIEYFATLSSAGS